MRGGIILMAALCSCGRIGFDAGAGDAGGGDDDGVPDGGEGMPAVRSRLDLDRVNPSQPLQGFPLLVVLTGERADLAAMRADASDVRFREASGAVIPHEIDEIAGDGTVFAWVRVPLYASSSDFITVEYGGTPAALASGPMWDETYEAVWHFAAASPMADSSFRGRSGTPSPGVAGGPGKIGTGLELDFDNGEYVVVGDGAFAAADELTLSAWVSTRDTPLTGEYYAFVARQFEDGALDDLWLGIDDANTPSIVVQTDVGMGYVEESTVTPGVTTQVTGTWQAGTLRLFIDGEMVTSGPAPGVLATSPRPIFLGANRNGGGPSFSVPDDDFMNGMLDEVRIERVVRSFAWISAQAAGDDDRIITYGPVERL